MLKVTRRRAIQTGSALFLSRGLLSYSQETPLLGGFLSDKSQAIRTLFQPGDRERDLLLAKYFPGYMENQELSPLLPLTAVVRNGGNSKVKGYRFMWKCTMPDGPDLLYSRLFVSLPTPDAIRNPGTGTNSILHPGHYAVVTPLFFWSQTSYSRRVTNQKAYSLGSSQAQVLSFVNASSKSLDVKIARLAKICKHTAFGSNLDPDVAYYQSSRNAERDAAAALLSTLHREPNIDDSALIVSIFNSPWSVPSTEPNSEIYTAARLKYSQIMATAVESHGIENMLSRISQTAFRTTTKLNIRPRSQVKLG